MKQFILNASTWARPGVLALAAVALALPGVTLAQSTVSPPAQDLEVMYSVNRVVEHPFETARAVEVITIDDLWRKNARTLPDVLMEEAGIFVQQTDYGAGSPIVRGLMGKQVLILIDGVKLNNATYRFGPIQYLSTIDINAVERIEVVRGVGFLFGSEALGGVINIIMKKGPGPGAPIVAGRVFGRHSTADQAWTSHVQAAGRAGDLRYSAEATYHNTDDLRAPNIGAQRATGNFTERGADLNAAYSFSTEKLLSFAYNAYQQNDVPRTDRVVSGTNLQFTFEPQRTQLTRITYEDASVSRREGLDQLQVNVYWNRQDEGNREIRADLPTTLRMYSDSQTVLGLTAEMLSMVGQTSRLAYGAEYATEDIVSRRDDLNLSTGALKTARGKLTDGSQYSTTAVYLQDQTDFGKWLTSTVGLRYSRFAASGSENTSVGQIMFDTKVSQVTGALNLILHATPNLNIVANATKGFRAPNLEDLSVFDERKEGTEVPNTDLKPESIVMYELGLKRRTPRLSLSAFVYQSNLNALLVRSSGVFNGLAYFDVNGNGVRDSSEPAVLQKKNLGSARIRGVELDWRARMSPSWTLFGNMTATRGDDLTANEPLSRIPPTFGALGLRWSSSGARQPWVEGVLVAAASQRRLSSADKSDVRIGTGGTDGFKVLNLRSGLSVSERLRFSLAWENVFNELYKYHGSGFYRSESQLVVGAELKF